MAIGANSYGSVAEVQALTLRYTTSGSYTTTTRPSIAQVEGFIDRVSSILNVLLAKAGFVIPVSQADAKLALDDYVVDMAVQLCHAANGSGPLAPGAARRLRGQLPREAILEAAAAFVGNHAAGFEALGATRTRTLTYGLDCLDATPIFEKDSE